MASGIGDPRAKPGKVRSRRNSNVRRFSFHGTGKEQSLKSKRETKEKINLKVRQKVEEFVNTEILQDERNEREGLKERREIRMSRFNLYEELFNTVIARNMDYFECVSNL